MDNSRENLVPIVINKLKDGEPPVIFGVDYQTPDGTCIRDYVDVRDIARAHLKVVESQISLPRALNIDTGKGFSMSQVVSLISILKEHMLLLKFRQIEKVILPHLSPV
jgi:UDP-glucose 4-epimerase